MSNWRQIHKKDPSRLVELNFLEFVGVDCTMPWTWFKIKLLLINLSPIKVIALHSPLRYTSSYYRETFLIVATPTSLFFLSSRNSAKNLKLGRDSNPSFIFTIDWTQKLHTRKNIFTYKYFKKWWNFPYRMSLWRKYLPQLGAKWFWTEVSHFNE